MFQKRKIFTVLNRNIVTDNIAIENNNYEILYFQTINSTTGKIQKPINSTILLDQFWEDGNAIIETLDKGKPSGYSPLTSLGKVVSVNNFDTDGNYSLSDIPISLNLCLLYIITIDIKDYDKLNIENILNKKLINTTIL